MIHTPTAEEIRRWPVTVDVPTAGRCWLLGRDASYAAARRGEFPVPVIRAGRRLVVTRASVIAALGIGNGTGPPGRSRLADNANPAQAERKASS
jgi:hypothetical protein